MDSEQSSLKQADNRSQEDKNLTSKLFISNLDGKADIQETQRELKSMFEKCGQVESIAAKRSRTQEYCFAFVEMKSHSAAKQCIKEYNKTNFNGKNILVQFQDVSKCHRGRKQVGCFTCGKIGHFARECPNGGRDNGGRRGYHRRSRSPSEDSYRRRHKKHKRRRSDSSERDRSRTPKQKKHRKHSSRDDKEKRKRKHKHSYSSDS